MTLCGSGKGEQKVMTGLSKKHRLPEAIEALIKWSLQAIARTWSRLRAVDELLLIFEVTQICPKFDAFLYKQSDETQEGCGFLKDWQTTAECKGAKFHSQGLPLSLYYRMYERLSQAATVVIVIRSWLGLDKLKDTLYGNKHCLGTPSAFTDWANCHDNDNIFWFPAHDEPSTCRNGLVSPEQSVLFIPVRSTNSTIVMLFPTLSANLYGLNCQMLHHQHDKNKLQHAPEPRACYLTYDWTHLRNSLKEQGWLIWIRSAPKPAGLSARRKVFDSAIGCSFSPSFFCSVPVFDWQARVHSEQRAVHTGITWCAVAFGRDLSQPFLCDIDFVTWSLPSSACLPTAWPVLSVTLSLTRERNLWQMLHKHSHWRWPQTATAGFWIVLLHVLKLSQHHDRCEVRCPQSNAFTLMCYTDQAGSESCIAALQE